jgi:hypothetical protein
MPRKFSLLLAEWKNRGLEAFRNVVFQDASVLTQAYSKRKYLVDHIIKVQEEGKTLEESVAALDIKLGTCSLSFCLCQLQAADRTIVRWVKRRRVVVADPDNPEATPLRAARRR